MTPQEKAKDLIYKIAAKYNNTTYEGAKESDKYVNIMFAPDSEFWRECALIAIDEILKANAVWHINSIPHKYWTNVKNEIQKL